MYTDALTYAYNGQTQTSTAAAPLEVILSRHPPPMATKAEHSEPNSAKDFHSKWKAGIQRNVENSPKKRLETQSTYTKSYDIRLLREKNDHLTRGIYIYSRCTKGRKEIQTQTGTHFRR